ncbi:unnamed protein product, partial [Closterium sp. Yama58-4]
MIQLTVILGPSTPLLSAPPVVSCTTPPSPCDVLHNAPLPLPIIALLPSPRPPPLATPILLASTTAARSTVAPRPSSPHSPCDLSPLDAVHSWYEPPLSALLLRLTAEVGGGTAGGEAEADRERGGGGGGRGRGAGARVEGAAEGAEEGKEGEEGWSDVGRVAVRQLQALQSPDDLFSLFASLHSCVARSTSPPRHRAAAAAASPACQPVTRGSALGLFLRSLLLSFHHLPFQ